MPRGPGTGRTVESNDMTVNITTWGAFWLFACIFLVVELCFVRMGFDGFFTAFKTPAEKELQKALIENQRRKPLAKVGE